MINPQLSLLGEEYGAPTTVDPYDGLSADAKRTAKQRAAVAAGIHPLTRTATRPDLGTCGSCTFRVLYGHHNRTYPKCVAEGSPKPTHGGGTDVRAWWPACEQHLPAKAHQSVGPDAARWQP